MGRFILDIPNIGSPEFEITKLIEEYLGRQNRFDLTVEEFETMLNAYFVIDKKEIVGPMIQYFWFLKSNGQSRMYAKGGRTMGRPISIGAQSFEFIRKNECFFVDKTDFIKDWWEMKDSVTLITRPRRFGKTLNLSMLRYYFEDTKDEEENQQNRKLFSGLAIGAAGEQYRREQCQYPGIMVTLKSAKQPTYENAMHCLQETLADEYARHEAQVEGNLKSQADWEKYMRIRERKGTEQDYLTCLAFLSKCLKEA